MKLLKTIKEKFVGIYLITLFTLIQFFPDFLNFLNLSNKAHFWVVISLIIFGIFIDFFLNRHKYKNKPKLFNIFILIGLVGILIYLYKSLIL